MAPRSLLTAVLVASISFFAQAQTLTLQDLVKVAACRDVPCFEEFARTRAFIPGGSEEDDLAAVYQFLSPRMNADSSHDELNVLFYGDGTDTSAVPEVEFMFYDSTTFGHLQMDLAAFGLEVDEPDENVPVVGDALVTTYISSAYPGLSVWFIVSEEDAPDGGPSFYMVRVENVR